MTHDKRTLIYLGWQGNNNFGDELLYDSWRAALRSRLDVTAPLTLGRYLVKEAGQFARARARSIGGERLVLLGGGTTIGFRTWAEHAKLARRMFGASGLVIPGAGAAEAGDDFLLSKQPHDWAAWRREPHVALLGVRGPLTAAECAEHWEPTGVIGDPALLYPRHVHLPSQAVNTIGLCLGSEGTSRFDVPRVVHAVRSAAAELGASITLFEMTSADRPVTDRLAGMLGRDARVERFDGSVHAMMTAIAGCRVMVSERLHGVVAAVAAGVPAVPLAYASKCDDFWLSVTGSRATIKPGFVEDALRAEIRRSLDDARVLQTARRVDRLGEALDRAAESLAAWLAGAMSSRQLLGLRAHDLGVGGS